ncbi:MAG TPA: UDP-N-acetylmuramate dehydrogenase [Fimbriimonadaceae bacterium]|nr:UDP-N-acetylmuramate dehydrogenase [Fimbriimonadaceae bacterium]
MAALIPIDRNVSLVPFTTLRAGGSAEFFAIATSTEQLGELLARAQSETIPVCLLGAGSNILPADDGVHGLVIVNRSRHIEFSTDGTVISDTGVSFQELFLKCAQRGLGGLEYAVGIPGTLGGALVSNAGAYRSNVSEFLTALEIVVGSERHWVPPSWMEFKYRDSVLRSENPRQAGLLRAKFELPRRKQHDIYEEARDYQRQRISKQPPPASAGSFFKNVNDPELARSLPSLPPKLKEAGVVPAGYLIEHVGLRGYRREGAMFGQRHANFILNVGQATASAIRTLANIAKTAVHDRFGVVLEEEVMYLGDWGRFVRTSST